MQRQERFTIGRLAKSAQVGIQTVRFYERKGLLTQPGRQSPGYRQYNADHLARIRFIKRAQQLGFSLKEVKALLEINALPRATCAQVKEKANRKLEEIVSKIRDLQRMKLSLERLAKACNRSKPAVAQCRVLDCFDCE